MFANQHVNPRILVDENLPSNISPDGKDLLLKMLETNPAKRPTAEECLEHPWFENDREAIQGSLLINKNQELFTNYCTNMQ